MHPLLRLALLFCPADYRHRYARSIAADTDVRGISLFAASMDLIYQGVLMHVENIGRDLSFAVRSIAKSPAYALTVMATIALAIGVNVAAGSVLEGVLFRGLPYPQAQQLVFISQTRHIGSDFSLPNLADVRTANRTLTGTGASAQDRATLTGRGRPVALNNGRLVNGSYFSVLGTHPRLGRFLDAGDVGTHRAVISTHLWLRYFAANPRVVGKLVTLDGRSYQIVGVAPAAMRDPTPLGLLADDYWIPVDPRESIATSRGYDIWTAVARLRPGATVTSAEADVNRILGTLAQRYPHNLGDFKHAGVSTLVDRIAAPVRTMLWLIYAAVAMVLLVACANLANLHLVRLSSRDGELAVRSALGASSSRILKQLTVETALLAAIGGTGGLAIAWFILQMFEGVAATMIPRWENVQIDGTILLYAAILVAITTLFTGIVPAIIHRRDASTTLKAAGRSGDRSMVKRLRSALVAIEVALALGLVLSAGLVARSFFTLTHVDVGFNSRNLYVVDFGSLTGPQYKNIAAQLNFARSIADRLRALPDITGASVAWNVPFSSDRAASGFTIPGSTQQYPSTTVHAIDAGYFKTLDIPLVKGRGFASQDTPSSPAVVIVNESFARTYFGSLDVIGRRIIPGLSTSPGPNPVSTIVGVAGNTRSSFGDPVTPEYYLPITQFWNFDQVAVRTSGSDAGLGQALAGAFRDVDPSIPAPNVSPMYALLAQDAVQSQAGAMLFGVLAGIALLLAMAGIYAVTSYGVAQRTHEFGIRKAIGARDGEVIGNVLLHAAAQSILGIAAGLVIAASFARFMASILFETSPLDVPTYVGVVLLLVGCTVAAALVPALRAMRVQPARALRYE